MNRLEFRQGMRGGIVAGLSAAPFAVLFGAVAVDNGLGFGEVAMMSALVYAGASQIVGIELFGQRVAPWLIVLSVLAVNFRHILYSAAVSRHIAHFSRLQKALSFFLLTDPQFAESVRRGENGIKVRFSWYMGFALAVYVPWLIFSMAGAVFGRLIGDPQALAIDVLLPAYFLGLVMGFRRKRHFYPVVLASGAAAVAAFYLIGSPWHVSIGAATGVALAALLPPAPDAREA